MSSTLAFARSLYSLDAIQATAAAYETLARFEIVAREHEVEVTLTDLDPEVPHLVDEIANHALYETVQRHRSVEGGS